MRRRLLTIGAALVAAVTDLPAWGGPTTESPQSSPAATTTSAAQAHNQADVTFAQNMIPHHQQAIQMSDTILGKQNIDPRVMQLATQIKAAQGPEIQQMQTWLNQWGQPTMSMTPGMGGTHGTPGMMSEQDMSALQSAQGVDAGKLFLTQMIQHH